MYRFFLFKYNKRIILFHGEKIYASKVNKVQFELYNTKASNKLEVLNI